ncbi:MAG: c-type cytochrome [Deltaproteobacteria bacterium]|nr:c-type cytochrome [Deltaproteobacteria bacterium]
MKRLAVALFVVAGLGAIASNARAQAADPAGQPRGAQVYAELCQSCHGRYGRGDGPLASNLKAPLVDFTNSAWLGGRSDEVIAKGLGTASHGPMTIASALKPEALQDSIAYIRALSIPGKHVSVLAGRDIYLASCQGCHGAKGDGQGPVATYLTDPKPRDFTASKFVIDGREEELEKFISLGAAAAMHGSIYMPEWASRLSPQQIKDTVEYLKIFKQAKP